MFIQPVRTSYCLRPPSGPVRYYTITRKAGKRICMLLPITPACEGSGICHHNQPQTHSDGPGIVLYDMQFWSVLQ